MKTGVELLESGERFAVTMWEYSWLVQRNGLTRAPIFGPEDEYGDWDKVLDELVERGYNCIRIDAHPHLIAAGPNGERQDTFTMLPIDDHFMWGNHEDVVVNPRQGLIEFMQMCKNRELYIGLSSWYNDDAAHRKLMITSPADYVRIWTETLDALNEADLLDIVVWVDVCNEFPLPGWAPGPFADIFGVEEISQDLVQVFQLLAHPWSDHTVQRFNAYLSETVAGLKASYPDLKYTFSLTSFGADEVRKHADASVLDVLEPHIWTTDDMEWMQKSGMFEIMSGDPVEMTSNYVRYVMGLYPGNREQLRGILDHHTDLWGAWAKTYNLPLITTEAWTMVLYEDISPNGSAGEWDWFKEVAEIGVRLAIDKGWQGICTSNFCEPHFEGMWRDVAWHQRLTNLIRGNSEALRAV